MAAATFAVLYSNPGYLGSREPLNTPIARIHLREKFSTRAKVALQWSKNHLYPPTVSRRAQARSQAHHSFDRNRRTTQLCGLPVELILEIADHLQYADTMAFRLSCRYFYLVLQSAPSKIPPSDLSEAQKDLSQRHRRDWFAEQAILEEATDICKLKQILCRACRTRHPQSAFTNDAITASPRVRTCIAKMIEEAKFRLGTEGLFRPCDHQSYTFDQLKRFHGKNLCTLHQYPWDTTPKLSELGSGTILGLGKQSYHVCRIRTVLSRRPARTTTYQDVKAALHQMDDYICPHLRTSSGAYITISHVALLMYLKKHKNIAFRSQVEETSSNQWPIERHAAWASCPSKDCRTEYQLNYDQYSHRMEYTVLRWLGPLESPVDEVWLAQLEAPGP